MAGRGGAWRYVAWRGGGALGQAAEGPACDAQLFYYFNVGADLLTYRSLPPSCAATQGPGLPPCPALPSSSSASSIARRTLPPSAPQNRTGRNAKRKAPSCWARDLQ